MIEPDEQFIIIKVGTQGLFNLFFLWGAKLL